MIIIIFFALIVFGLLGYYKHVANVIEKERKAIKKLMNNK